MRPNLPSAPDLSDMSYHGIDTSALPFGVKARNVAELGGVMALNALAGAVELVRGGVRHVRGTLSGIVEVAAVGQDIVAEPAVSTPQPQRRSGVGRGLLIGFGGEEWTK